MPTGYTAGILDGTVTDFPQFAKACMRAFGAVIHMRDEPMDKPYEKRTPSDYHDKAIVEARKLKKEAETLTDKQILERKKEENEQSIKRHEEAIEKGKRDELKLREFLSEVEEFEPPTGAHKEFKKFMADQITKTIDFDCGSKYHEEALLRIKSEAMNPETIRAEMIASADKDIAYHSKERAEEIKRCEDSNRWVDDLLLSLEK